MHLIGIVVAFFVIRGFFRMLGGDGGRGPTRLYILMWILLLIAWPVVIGLLESEPLYYLLIPVLLVLTVPSLVLRWVTEPLGLVKPSYRLGRLSLFLYRRDRAGGALFSGVKAWMQGKRREDDRVWLLRKIQECQPMMGAGVVASALIHEGRVDDRVIYGQLGSLTYGHLYHVPKRCKKTAFLWLVAYEAERGNWGAVIPLYDRLVSDLRWPTGWFIRAAARRLRQGHSGPGKRKLAWLYGLTFSPRLNALYKLALQADESSLPVDLTPTSENRTFNEAVALTLPLMIESGQEVSSVRVHAVGRYWEELLASPQARAQLQERLDALGGGDAQRLIQLLTDNLRNQLTELAQRARGEVREEAQSLLVASAQQEGRDSLFEQLEYAVAGIAKRTADEQALSAANEWLEWSELRILQRRLHKEHSDRHIAFRIVLSDLWNWAAWLWNVRNERLLAHAVFAWLVEEAMALDEEAVAKQLLPNLGLPLYIKIDKRGKKNDGKERTENKGDGWNT